MIVTLPIHNSGEQGRRFLVPVEHDGRTFYVEIVRSMRSGLLQVSSIYRLDFLECGNPSVASEPRWYWWNKRLKVSKVIMEKAKQSFKETML